MAKAELVLWKDKAFPAESVAKIEAMIESTEVDRKQLDSLDDEVAGRVETPDQDTVKRWSRVASGLGNKLRKLYTRLEATVRNAEATRCTEILFECERDGVDYKDGAAKMSASAYVCEIRKARNLLQGYVESADIIMSTCRIHNGQGEKDRTSDVSQ